MSNAPLGTPEQNNIQQRADTPHKAGAFDIRNVIAALIGFYGIVLIIVGLVADSAQQRAKTGNVNANLWAGIAMAIVAVSFVVWARLRPAITE
jgi:glucose uptake protein GlcU